MLISPLQAEALVTSTFADHQNTGRPAGVDLIYKYRLSEGQPLLAVTDGIIQQEGIDQYGGHWFNLVGSGYLFQYVHNKEHLFYNSNLPSLKKGETRTLNTVVKQGDIIATLGNTGWSTGPHLHLAVFQNGRAIDPLNIIDLKKLYMNKVTIPVADLDNLQLHKSVEEQKVENEQIFYQIITENPKIIQKDFWSSFRFNNESTKTQLDLFWQHILAIQEVLNLRDLVDSLRQEINNLNKK